jgi:hypothetical protein
MNLLKVITGILLLPVLAVGQIPNASFENWSNLIPDGWIANVSPPLLLPVSSTTDAHTGNYAIKGEIVDDLGVAFGPYITPVSSGLGFPVTNNDTAVYGFSKASLIGSNLGLVEVSVYDSLFHLVGSGITFITNDSDYSEFYIPVIFSPGAIAYQMSIIIQMTDTDSTSSFNVGSYFIIDDLSFEHTSTVNIQSPRKDVYSVSQNPGDDYIILHSSNAASKNQFVAICDVAGRKILSKNLVMTDDNNFVLNISSLTNGIYILAVTDGRNRHSQKIIVRR